jgi:hypothetical protein
LVVSSRAAFLLAVACLTIDSKLAKALAELICLSKMAFFLTSSTVIVFLLALLGLACYLEIKVGVKLGAALTLPPVGKFIVGKLPVLIVLVDEEEDEVVPEAYEVGTLRESRRALIPASG